MHDAESHFSALRKLYSIADQVKQDLPEPSRIATQLCRHPFLDKCRQFDLVLIRALDEQIERAFDDLPQIEIERLEMELARFDFRKIENIIDDRQKQFRA